MRKLKLSKNNILAILLTAACVVVGTLCIVKAVDSIKYRETIIESELVQLENIIITADGGNGLDVPKNTKYAIDDLSGKFFTSVEIDARLTLDKKWVALAESDISSVTDGRGDVKNYNYYNLLNHNIKNFKPNEFPVIELTANVAKYSHENGVSPIIHIHNNNKAEIKKLVGSLNENATLVTHFASSDLKILEYVSEITTDAGLIYYVDEITDEAIETAKKNPRYLICFDYEKNDKKDIERLIVDGVGAICRGADTLKKIDRCYNIGVRHFITDAVKVG